MGVDPDKDLLTLFVLEDKYPDGSHNLLILTRFFDHFPTASSL